MTMMDLAHHIIAVGHKKDIPVTNLQLQKVMFFSLKSAINEKLITKEVVKETYDQPFLVWRYGPVVASVYEEFRRYGATPIMDKFGEVDVFFRLNDTIIELLQKNVFELVRTSHKESFWEDNECKIVFGRSNVVYGIEDVGAC